MIDPPKRTERAQEDDSEEAVARRLERALQSAVNMSPKPHDTKKSKKVAKKTFGTEKF